MNFKNSHLSHIFMYTYVRERLMHLPLISFLTVMMLDISAVAGHGAVLAALLLLDAYLNLLHTQILKHMLFNS